MKSSNLALRLEAFLRAAESPAQPGAAEGNRSRPRQSLAFRTSPRSRFGRRTIGIRDEGFLLFRVR